VASFVQHMGVDHGRAYVFVAQQLLNRADVIARFQEMRCERMPEGMATGVFHDARFADGFLDGTLKNRFVNVMPSLFAGFRVLPAE
jgi:hypothetical protein